MMRIIDGGGHQKASGCKQDSYMKCGESKDHLFTIDKRPQQPLALDFIAFTMDLLRLRSGESHAICLSTTCNQGLP